MLQPLLEVNHLNVLLKQEKNYFHVIRDLSFHVKEGEILGIVGESGCGACVKIRLS